MTDLEMTRLCAKAMGVEIFNPQALEPAYQIKDHAEDANWYHPLHDNAQAMALVKKFPRETLQALIREYNSRPQSFSEQSNNVIIKCVAEMEQEKQK